MRTFAEIEGKSWNSNYGATVDQYYHLLPRSTFYYNSNPEFSYKHVVNALGFVAPMPGEEKIGKRIVFLGDSFAEGVGAASPDSSCPKLLQDLLNRQFGSESTEVLNFGVGGSDVVFTTKYLEDSTARFSPDLVIMMFNNTDIYDLVQRGGRERFLADGTVAFSSGPWFLALVKYSHLVRLIVVNGFGYDSELWIQKHTLPHAVNWALGESIDNAKLAQEISTRMGANFLFVLMPFGSELASKRQEIPLQFLRMQQQLETEGVHTLNLWDGMAQHINQSNFTAYSWWRYDGHYKHTGYQLMAEILASDQNVTQLFHSPESDTMQIIEN